MFFFRNYISLAEEREEQKMFVADVIYFTGSCYSCNSDCKACRTMNFTHLVHKVKLKVINIARKIQNNKHNDNI